MITVNFYDRSYADVMIDPAVEMEVVSTTKSVEGGCKSAKVKATGAEISIWQFVKMLGYNAKFFSQATACWWGMLTGVRVKSANGFTMMISLDQMHNKVKVTYTDQVAGMEETGDQTETSWYSNTNSINMYGTKEKIFSLSDATLSQAVAAAQRALYDYGYPLSDRDFSALGTKGTPEGELTFTGWWDTLDWKTYSQTAGKEGYETIGTGLQALGDASGNTKVAQSFQLGSALGWNASTVAVRVNKEGAPTDNLVVELCANGSSAPGTVLASATLAGASAPDYLNWVTLTLSAVVALSISTTYWIQISRSGVVDGTNYFKVDANESLGYTRGSFKIYNGATWAARSPDADMLFALTGGVEISLQISQIMSTCGQFFNGSRLDAYSGLYSSPYRDGSQSGLVYARELLRSGTTNYRRLMATVDESRKAVISEEPGSGYANTYWIDQNGVVTDPYNNPIDPEFMPAGVWLQAKGVIPAEAAIIPNPARVFVEETTWQAGKLKFSFRGMQGLINMFGVP
jgi:hypothetical protein